MEFEYKLSKPFKFGRIEVVDGGLATALNIAIEELVMNKDRVDTKSSWYQFGDVALLNVQEQTFEPIGFCARRCEGHLDLDIYDGYSYDELYCQLSEFGRVPGDRYKQFKGLYDLTLWVLDELRVGVPVRDAEYADEPWWW